MTIRRTPTVGMFSGAIAGALIGVVLFYFYLEPEQSAPLSAAFRQVGVFTMILGGWLGRTLIHMSLPMPTRNSFNISNLLIVLFAIAGIGLGIWQALVQQAKGEETTAVLGSPLILWPILLGMGGFWLGNRTLQTGSAIRQVPATTGYATLGALLMALLGATLNALDDSFKATIDQLLTPANLTVAFLFGLIGFGIAGRIIRISYTILRLLLGYAFVGALIGILLLAYLPAETTSLQTLLISGGSLGIAGSMLLIKRSAVAFIRTLIGAGIGTGIAMFIGNIPLLVGLSGGAVITALLHIGTDKT